MEYQESCRGSLGGGTGLGCWGKDGDGGQRVCVGHMEQEAPGPDVARGAHRMRGLEHPLHVG